MLALGDYRYTKVQFILMRFIKMINIRDNLALSSIDLCLDDDTGLVNLTLLATAWHVLYDRASPISVSELARRLPSRDLVQSNGRRGEGGKTLCRKETAVYLAAKMFKSMEYEVYCNMLSGEFRILSLAACADFYALGKLKDEPLTDMLNAIKVMAKEKNIWPGKRI